jgi:autotransporter-associated beta strand protein
MRIFPKNRLLVWSPLIILLVATVAWGSITSGFLTSSQVNVDLSSAGSYQSDSATNEIRLVDSEVTLGGTVTLGSLIKPGSSTTLSGYATNYNDVASTGAAGGAIFIGEGETLSFYSGISGEDGVSLRLFGQGTTNIYSSANSYSYTFIQSGKLNIASTRSLGGSIVTMGGGSTLGIVEGESSELNLSSVNLNVRRYNSNPAKASGSSGIVAFDTGRSDSNRMTLPQIKQLTADGGSLDDITISKRGKGRLVVASTLGHTGDTVVEDGILEIQSQSSISRTVEIRQGAAMATTSSVLILNVDIKPHGGARVILPKASKAAALSSENIGSAILTVRNINPEIEYGESFYISADLSGISRPEGVEEYGEYFVKLISSATALDLEAADVKIEGVLREDFAESSYSVRPYVDGHAVYALLSKDVTSVSGGGETEDGTLDVVISDIYDENQNSNITAVRIHGNEALTGETFKYVFEAIGGLKTGDVDNPVSNNTVFTARDVTFDPKDPRNLIFYIDRNNLVADDGQVYQLVPGINYRLVIRNATGDNSGASDVQIRSDGIYVPTGELVLLTYAEPVSSDSIAAYAMARKDGIPQTGVRIDFELLDIFGNPVNVQGIPNNPYQLTDIDGRADVTFRGLPYGRYTVRAKAAGSQYVGYSREIEFAPEVSVGGGGGCDLFPGALALLFAAVAWKSRRLTGL